jgi:hypothetical protein
MANCQHPKNRRSVEGCSSCLLPANEVERDLDRRFGIRADVFLEILRSELGKRPNPEGLRVVIFGGATVVGARVEGGELLIDTSPPCD